jgi:hypothetical protein
LIVLRLSIGTVCGKSPNTKDVLLKNIVTAVENIHRRTSENHADGFEGLAAGGVVVVGMDISKETGGG